jgi:hypothetical protein
MNKKLDQKLRRKLELEEQKNKQIEIREKYENKYVNIAIIFFGTLLPLYLMFFLLTILFNFFFGSALHLLGVSLAWIKPLLHGAIWAASVISVIRNRSVLDDLFNRF